MTYQIDPKHSAVHFQVRHMTIALVRGSFGALSGTVDYDPANPEASKVDVSIAVNSVQTLDPDRNGHLQSPDIFDAAAHPSVTFKSTKVTKNGNGLKVDGDLTLRGVTKPASLDVSQISDEVTDPWTLKRRAAVASATINRGDYGMGWNMELPGVGKMVSDEVELTLLVQFTRSA